MCDQMLNIVCVNAQNYLGMGKQYVETLHDMVNRNISNKTEYKFICFTDDEASYAEGIEKRPLHGGLAGWYNKLYLFKKDLFPEGDKIIFFDLDTAIVSGLDEIINYQGPFAILRDVYRPKGMQSSVIMWQAGNYSFIWEDYEKASFPNIEGGDQAWIEQCLEGLLIDRLQDVYPGCFRSYKVDCQEAIPKGTKVAFFHGSPRPHRVKNNWVEAVWKIGGGSIIEFEINCNTSSEELSDNIDYALSLDIPHINQEEAPHDKSLCIIGGGPSLKIYLTDLRKRQSEGQIIWALNNSFKWLIERGIYPDGHLILDAREENAAFVPESTKAVLLYASQCHPKTLDAGRASGGQLHLWHAQIDGIIPRLAAAGYEEGKLVGCGDTVGMKALGLAQLTGFRDVHLFGYDSSYEGEANHAYAQPLNDGEELKEVTANGNKFICAAWMALQAEQFRELAPMMVANGMGISVHGYGLLPYIATLLAEPA